MSQISSNFQDYLNATAGKVDPRSVQAVLSLVSEGATVPFIARYRKEKTGNLDEVQIRAVIDSFEKYNEIIKRKKFILEEIEKQGNLTVELKTQLESSMDLAELEELYRPYKRKKKTKAKMAKEAGLGDFAEWVWRLGHGELQDNTSLEVKAKDYINPTAGFATYDEVLRGAQHIIVERLSNNGNLRKLVRDDYFAHGVVVCQKGKKYKTNSKYEKYADYREPVKSLESKKASHRYLALRRGWNEAELTVSIEANDAQLLQAFEAEALSVPQSQSGEFLKNCAKIALTVHVVPSVANELHGKLKNQADQYAIQVFAENVRRVLMASPFGPKVVLGIDPGVKTGCKLALVDNSGQYISSTVMFMIKDEDRAKAKKLFEEVFKQIKIEVVAVGNGTGGREAQVFVQNILKEIQVTAPVILVNEAGASVYSASDVAREEFPDLDVTVRGAISIARRLQDPLAELVKIEPKSIGVGQYQHDVSQTDLKKSLYDVVESCVNQVGVDLNTASSALLQYVAGIGPAIAKNIVAYRGSHGLFKARDELLKVPSFSSKAFEQAAGFLRVPNSQTVLDRTGIHPERYSAVKDMASELGLSVSQLFGDGAEKLIQLREKWTKLVGEFTFDDIVKELRKPGRDPRDPFKVFSFRDDIHEVKDLKKDMVCPGIVTNVTNFGAFVDIGVHQDGLVHLSQLSHSFVEDPKTVVSPGDQVQVKVLDVDIEKNQISLSMLLTERPKPAAKQKPRVNKGEGRRKQAGGRQKKRGPGGGSGKPRQQRPPAKPFNNPFAALTNLKK